MRRTCTGKATTSIYKAGCCIPLNYDETKKYPLVVSVHGGPAAAKKPAWPGAFDMSLLSSQGYFVLFPNPRGSFGEGETFTKANVRDFG